MTKTYVRAPQPAEPLVKFTVYMHAAQKRRLREQAARLDMSMSEYLKFLIDQDSSAEIR